MRNKLDRFYGNEIELTCKFRKYAITNDFKNLLFVDVYYKEELVTNHVWINYDSYKEEFDKADIFNNRKATVKFLATIIMYTKNSKDRGRIVDLGLTNIKNVEIVNEN